MTGSAGSLSGSFRLRFADDGGQLDGENAAFAGHAVHGHVAAHHLAEAAREGQPQTGAAELARGRGIGLGEVLKELDDLLGTHADAGVRHAKHDPLAAIHELALGVQRDACRPG